MASIERTAYPRFRRLVPSAELQDAYTPTLSEVERAGGAARSDDHLLALVVLLKCFQRLGYFPRLEEVPGVIVAHVRSCLELGVEVAAGHDSERTLRHHKSLIRTRLNVVLEPERARQVAEEAIREAAQVKDNPPDLINVALEELIRGRYELPGYTTLDEIAARVRAEVNGEFFARIVNRIEPSTRSGLERLLEVDSRTGRSSFDQLKQPAKAARLSQFQGAPELPGLGGLVGRDRRLAGGDPGSKGRTLRHRGPCPRRALNPVLRQSLRPELLVRHWDDLNRLAASLKDGLVAPSLIIAKLQALRRQNPLQQALQELGRVAKTRHILSYIDDEALRRRVLVGLNRQERPHAMAREIFFGRQGRFGDRGYEAQLNRASALSLVINALTVWNTRYLHAAAEELPRRGRPIPEDAWTHLTPLLWEHVHLVGHYRFEEPVITGELRALRMEEIA